MTTPRIAPPLAAVLTFLAAGCVLVLEIAAGRLLAPYVGVSLTTYTGIIGVVLAGISAGAWAGGRLADREAPERLIGPTIALGGLTAMAGVPLVGTVGELGLGTDPLAIVVLACVGFVAPAAVLSAVAPMIVRASLTDVASSGSLVGRLSAIGTLGAIAGTFLTGFVLLGLVPTRLLVLGTGALLVAIGVALTLSRPGGRPTGPLLLGAALVVGRMALLEPEPCERESAYFCMSVVSDPANEDGRTLVLDRVRHAYVDLGDPTRLEFRYERWFADASGDLLARDRPPDVLHIGGGGFTFPRYVLALHPESRHTILELDPEVLAIARDELGLDPAGLDVRLGDARTALGRLPADSYDLVVGDAFAGLSVPWHLTTAETLREIDRVLRPGGRYVMNIIDGPRMRFARAETRTMQAVWPHVAVIVPSSALEARGGSNVVLVASSAPIDTQDIVARLRERNELATEVLGTREALAAFTGAAPMLTDDYAPVDQLLVP